MDAMLSTLEAQGAKLRQELSRRRSLEEEAQLLRRRVSRFDKPNSSQPKAAKDSGLEELLESAAVGLFRLFGSKK